jgi:hypothetical protein
MLEGQFRVSGPAEGGRRVGQELIDGLGERKSSGRFIARGEQDRGGFRPLKDQLCRTAVIERYDRRPERERFRHAQSRLLMKGRMKKDTCSRNLREQLIPRKPSLESNAIRQPPPPYRALEAWLFRSFSTEDQNCIRILDATESLKREHRRLPGQQPPDEQHLGVPLYGGLDAVEFNS